MSDTSASGGPLLPAVSTPPVQGRALQQFIQAWIVGISGLSGDMVRPRWQAEPPNIPDSGNAWASIGITRTTRDTYPYVKHFCDNELQPPGPGHDQLQRHEQLDILCSFYDLGVDGQADFYASQTSDGMCIAQNREVLLANGWGFVEAKELVTVPSLLKVRWVYRVDLPIVIRRAIVRTYPVENILSLGGTVTTDTGVTETLIPNP